MRRVFKHEKIPRSVGRAVKKEELYKRYYVTAREEDWEAYMRQRNTTRVDKNVVTWRKS